MAKKKASQVNKSEAVRKVLAKSPNLSPKEIVEKLKSTGVKVTPAYVSNVKSQSKKGRRGRPVASKGRRRGTNGHATGELISIDALKQARELIENAGGVDKAKKALDVVADLGM